MEIWAKGNNVKLEYSTDRGDTWNEVDTYTLAGSYPSDDSPVIAYFDVVSTKIRYRFSNRAKSEAFTLKQFVSKYMDREVRR